MWMFLVSAAFYGQMANYMMVEVFIKVLIALAMFQGDDNVLL